VKIWKTSSPAPVLLKSLRATEIILNKNRENIKKNNSALTQMVPAAGFSGVKLENTLRRRLSQTTQTVKRSLTIDQKLTGGTHEMDKRGTL
jgi:hypothetical protein